MSCAAFEGQIARDAGGDLAAEEIRALEQHLRACPECAELARALEDDRAWLASRPPEAAEVDYAAMRREIRAAVSRPRRNWKWLPVAAAILLAFGVAWLWRTPAPHPPSRPEVARVAQAPLVERVHPAIGRPRRRVPKAPPQPDLTLEAAIHMFEQLDPAPPPSSDSPVEMRFATRNPKVTIILVQESKGDSQ